ncbi:hypothetical protein [Glutamicibacter sp. AOP3-A1-12]|uniref:hypothetical protein n=1 Tax=Glutamicibacter sp. AOP3-A1-12 TaxID=3457701 RepID=UPI00403425B0
MSKFTGTAASASNEGSDLNLAVVLALRTAQIQASHAGVQLSDDYLQDPQNFKVKAEPTSNGYTQITVEVESPSR